MAVPSLPAHGSPDWFAWAQGIDSAARNAARTDTANVFTGDQRIDGYLGVGASPDPKQPVVFTETLNGPAVIASGSLLNKISHQINAIVTGDFTSDGGADPAFLWGQNVFTLTGPNANDGKGIDTLTSSLVEVNVNTPAGTTFGTVCAQEVSAAFWGATAGAHINTMMSMFVRAPRRVQGATGGTVDNAYTLFVEGVAPADVGASDALSLFVSGGVSRFGGRVDVNGVITATAGSMTLQGALGAPAASLILNDASTGGGGHAQLKLGATGSVFALTSSGGSNVLVIDNTGAVSFTLGTTTTAPSAGGAGALPATPAGYATLTINGTARKVAYY